MPELSEQNQEKRKRKSQWNTTNNMSATSRRIMLYWQMTLCTPMTELKRFLCDNNRAKERENLPSDAYAVLEDVYTYDRDKNFFVCDNNRAKERGNLPSDT